MNKKGGDLSPLDGASAEALIKMLVEGINPLTLLSFDQSHPIRHPEVVNVLLNSIELIEKNDFYSSINNQIRALKNLESDENILDYLDSNYETSSQNELDEEYALEGELDYQNEINDELDELLYEIEDDQNALDRSNEEGWAYDDNDNLNEKHYDAWAGRMSDALDRADKESDAEFKKLLRSKRLNGHEDFHEIITEPPFIYEVITSQLDDMDHGEDITEYFLRLTSPNFLVHEIALEWVTEYLGVKSWQIFDYEDPDSGYFAFDIHDYKNIWVKIIQNVFSKVNLQIEIIPNDKESF